MPPSRISGVRSISATGNPYWAKTWAMPLPMVPAPTTVTFLISMPALSALHDHSAGFPPADADCRHPPARVSPLQRVDERHENPCPAGADRVAEDRKSTRLNSSHVAI